MFDEDNSLDDCYDADIKYICATDELTTVLMDETVDEGSYIQLTFKEVEAIYHRMKQLKTMENV